MIHSSANYVVKDIGSINFWVGNILDSLSRIGVPLFLMISGALMLDKNYKCSTQKLIKHIKKMIIFFIFWSEIYCIVSNIIISTVINHQPFNKVDFIVHFIQGHYHLWFIYLIIGLYLIVPLLRLWVKNENKKSIEYFLILSIIFTYIIQPIINIGMNFSDIFKTIYTIIENQLCLKYIGGYTSYFILGYYIHNYDIKHKRTVYILGIFGLIITIFGTYIISNSTQKAIQMYDNLSLNVLLQSTAIFLFIRTKFINDKNHQNIFIDTISKNSLGIYAMHVLIINLTYTILQKIGLESAIINIPIVFIASFTLSFLVTYILSKIPILKKIV